MFKWSLFLVVCLSLLALALPSSPIAFSSPEEVTFSSPLSYKLPGGIVDSSSPTLADLTGDGVPEIIVGTTDFNGINNQFNRPRMLVVMSGNGTVLWSRDMGAPINASPTVGDINRDGFPDVVVAFGGSASNLRTNGGVVAFDRNGNQMWRFNTLDWHPDDGFSDGVFGSPALCDVDNDGDTEIAFGSWDQNIYLLDHLGNSLWNQLQPAITWDGFHNADSVWSSASCADLNRDGDDEIVIGADISGGGVLPDGTPTQNGGFLYVFDGDGDVLVRRYMPEVIASSPAIGDLDGNGTLEIVVGTGWFWWRQGGDIAPSYVYAFDTSHLDETMDYANPNKLPYLPGWPQRTDYPGFSSPALADLDGNGDLEIVIAAQHPDINNDDILGTGKVYAWHHTGQLVSGWPVTPKNAEGIDGPIFSSPTIADIDHDGGLEILFSMLWDVQVYNTNGSFQERLHTTWTISSSPAIGDTDNDGKMDVWIGGGRHGLDGGDQSSGYLWNFEQLNTGTGALPWPQFHRTARKTGYYNQALYFNSPAHTIRHSPDDGTTVITKLRLNNASEQNIPATGLASSSRVQVSPSSFTVPANGYVTLTLTTDTQGLSNGLSGLGMLSITGAYVGPWDDVAIPISIFNGNAVYLPLSQSGTTSNPDLIYWQPRSFALPGAQIYGSSPVAADLNGDGQEEVIIGSSTHVCDVSGCNDNGATLLTASRSDGSLMWSADTRGPVENVPAVADINRDGSPEVVVAVGKDPYKSGYNGRVVAYNSQGGQLWEFYTHDRFGNGYTDGIMSSPSLCDLDGDGYLETIFGALDGYIYAVRSNGQLMWQYDNGYESRSTAACSDLNGDGRPEIIIGTHSDVATGPTRAGGFLLIFSNSGTLLVRRSLPETVRSSPAVGDLNGDGRKEIVVGTGVHWWMTTGGAVTPMAYVFDTPNVYSGLDKDDANKLPLHSGWPQQTDYPTDSSPALADLDGNGDLEIVLGTAHPTLTNDNIPGAGSVYAWHHTGQLLPGWPVHPLNLEGDDGPIQSTPLIGDIDQDGAPEVVFSMLWKINIYNANGSEQLYTARTGYTLSSSPLITDTDNDGHIEIWAGSSFYADATHGYLWRYESNNKGYGSLDWPMVHQNAAGTGEH